SLCTSRSHSSIFLLIVFLFFFLSTSTTDMYTLSLHDALPISPGGRSVCRYEPRCRFGCCKASPGRSHRCIGRLDDYRSLPPKKKDRKSTRLNSKSRRDLVCRLLLEKKNKKNAVPQRQNGPSRR